MRYFYIIIFSLICLNLQGCFSEVESTPKISYKHINTEESNQPKSIISHILNQPFCEWKDGKEFIVTDNKISHILFSKTKADSFLGSSIYFAKYKTITSITGNKSTELVFLSQDGDSLFYHINTNPIDLKNLDNLEIPFTIQKSLVDEVKKCLVNKRLYIITPNRYDFFDNLITSRKFVPIIIKDVVPGNSIYPIKLIFNDNGQLYYLYMTVGNQIQATRNFEKLFSITNPHDKYPHISKNHWDKISNNSIVVGMTSEECQLSLGSPSVVTNITDTDIPTKTWEYEDGTILHFENGILIKTNKNNRWNLNF